VCGYFSAKRTIPKKCPPYDWARVVSGAPPKILPCLSGFPLRQPGENKRGQHRSDTVGDVSSKT